MAMEMRRRSATHASQRGLRWAVYLLTAASQVIAAQAEPFVAGTTPDRRPEAAPKIETFERSLEWMTAASQGVVQPFPRSLEFLNDQGRWYNPFLLPGMTGPYDIRGYHSKAAAAATEDPKLNK